jgi:hypothetical protein
MFSDFYIHSPTNGLPNNITRNKCTFHELQFGNVLELQDVTQIFGTILDLRYTKTGKSVKISGALGAHRLEF